MQHPVYGVSDLISFINQSLEHAYPAVVVEGEVASFKISKNKYVFFDIKDNEGVLGCFLMLYALRMPLEDGMKVRLVAEPRLTAWGKFSLNVRQVMPIGEGNIKRAFDLLKAKLDKEGLFDPARKRLLPKIPRKVALVASMESAGYADFIKIVNHRWGGLDIEVANVQVQGLGASEQIIAAIDFFNQQAEPADVLVIIRGGGSSEDLAVFNEEPLVRAVAGSRITSLVGVGHEVDTSLCDLAADVRAATPSNAAQILVPDRQAILAEITQSERRFLQQISYVVASQKVKVTNTAATMTAQIERAITDTQKRLKQTVRLLQQFDPQTVLQRGYALVRVQSGALVKGAATGLKAGDQLTITTSHAIIKAGVNNVQPKNN